MVWKFCGKTVSGESPETMRKLCLSTKFPHHEVKWNDGILCSVLIKKLSCKRSISAILIISLIFLSLLKQYLYHTKLSFLLLSQTFYLDTAWKVSKYGVFSGPYFSEFGMNMGKHGSEKTPYLDTFHKVRLLGEYFARFYYSKFKIS